ncbi:hypothetical protein D5S18_17965 [Nocardia panacis]|uniref:Uncharacterized protein n=1 Tax=Nocardia panacis TaxID=2340916 RepID=A0A3A4KQF8_9NOCA|nr:hypothetical protein [Nocardia panacis]RJO75240.1 hypothetical protein D5S18_17965 [Nocardia panacis]
MNRSTISRLFAALAACSIIAVPVAYSTVAAAIPMHQQPPGSSDPGDDHDWRDGGPSDRDRHCDSNGYWHDNDDDQLGHRDDRCGPW